MVRSTKEIDLELDRARAELIQLQVTIKRLEAERFSASLRTSKVAFDSKKNLEERRRKQWQGQIEVGDFVRVVGGRNSNSPWRKVTSINKRGSTGQVASITGQIARLELKPVKRFVLSGYMSTNGVEKIAELIKASDLAENNRLT